MDMSQITAAREKIIIALDVPDRPSAEAAMDRLGSSATWIKIGLQLFTAEGPDLVRSAQQRGYRIFLDLKFHDIPNTVAKAVASAAALQVEMTTLHTLGGPVMMRAAADAAAGSPLMLLGVTVLTSMDDAQLTAIGLPRPAAEQVTLLGRLALEAGLRGLVASPLETALLRQELGDDAKLVIPGIRAGGGAPTGDQKRTLSAGEAVKAGANWIVVGRPVMEAPDPAAALEALVLEVAAVGT